MGALFAIVVGGLYAAGIYMILRRSLFKVILGIVLLSHGANLLILTSGGLTRAQPAIIPPDATEPVMPSADPLPQALILTAIVISFGVLAFSLVLFHRAHDALGTDDSDQLREVDE